MTPTARTLPALLPALLSLLLSVFVMPVQAAQRPAAAQAPAAAGPAIPGPPMIARFPAPLMDDDPRAYYTQALIELAFSETPEQGPGHVVFATAPQERLRIEAELEKGTRLNIYLMPGTNAYDSRFLRVDVPVDRGLLGLRVGVIRAEDQARFAELRTLDDLRQIRIGSVLGWHLTDILQHNSLTTNVVPVYEDLYRMLVRNRLDLISRGATEVLREQAEMHFAYPDTMIETDLLLRMPLAFYIYVSPGHPALHQRIQTGLHRAIANGRFEAVFLEWFGHDLEALKLDSRHIIDLSVPDPHLPTLMMDPSLRLPLRMPGAKAQTW